MDPCTWAKKLHTHWTEDAGVSDPVAQIIRHESKKCLCARLMLEIFLMLPKDDIFKAVRQINWHVYTDCLYYNEGLWMS